MPLLFLVKPLSGKEGVVHSLLEGILFCRDLKQAVAWWEKHPHEPTLVTAKGEFIDRRGILWGGSQSRQVSVLEKRGERKALAAEAAQLEGTLEQERKRLQRVEEMLLQNSSRLEEMERRQRELREALLTQEKEQYRLHGEAQRITERSNLLEMEKEQESSEIAQLQADLGQSQEELDALEQSI